MVEKVYVTYNEVSCPAEIPPASPTSGVLDRMLNVTPQSLDP